MIGGWWWCWWVAVLVVLDECMVVLVVAWWCLCWQVHGSKHATPCHRVNNIYCSCGILSPCAGGDICSEQTAYEVVLPLREDAKLHKYLEVAARELVENVSATRTVREWHAEVVRVAQSLRSLGMIGCNVVATPGKLPYVAGWLARCLMLLKNQEAGAARLEVGTATLKDLGAAFPDAGNVAFDLAVQLAGSAKSAGTMLAADLFAELGYSGRPELFSMHCCFSHEHSAGCLGKG